MYAKSANINQIAATLPVPERFIPMTNAPKPKPTKANAKANLRLYRIIFPQIGPYQSENWCQQNKNKALKLKNCPAETS
jgi:hypothetical protein